MSASLPTAEDADCVTTEEEPVKDEASPASNLVRESADGGSTQSLPQNVITADIGKPTEETPTSLKEKENADLDLDKDIDVMIETNTDNGVINPDASTTISSIQVDLTEDSALDMSSIQRDQGVGDADSIDVNGNVSAERDTEQEPATTQAEVSEKSFASSTDSSLMAETVVKKVIHNAVTEINDNQNADESYNKAGEQEVKQVKSDIQVGLFQYGGMGEDGGESDEEEDTSDNDDHSTVDVVQKQEDSSKLTDLKVGLFQYMEDTAEITSPEVLELDDNEDEEDDNEDKNRGDILRLYGLEGLDQPVSPKSASLSGSGPPSMESDPSGKVIDVQRDVYEPQTRIFTVTKTSSSTDSTPRNDQPDNVEKADGRDEQEADNEDNTDIADEDTPRGSMNSDTKEDLKIDIDDRILCGNGQKVGADISPPLIRYEPVTDNGKFRIVKTFKEGVKTYSTIRVGTSPTQSPRETESQGQGSTPSENGSTPKQSPRQPLDLDQEGQPDHVRTDPTPPESRQGEDSQAIDKDLIRELIEKEKKSDLIPTKDLGPLSSSVTSQSNLDNARQKVNSIDAPKSPKQMSVSELRDSPRGQDGETKSSPREATIGGETEPSRISQRPLDDIQGRQLPERDQTGDSKSFERRYQSLLERDTYYSRSFDKDRFASVDPSRDSSSVSYHHSSYRDSQNDITAPRSPDSASIRQPIKPIDSGVIPGFKTLQEQQAKWSTMFRQLESEHRHELRSQYDKHQSNIKRLQQQMEHELQKQHVAIRKKLDLHKEALSKMSPDRDRPSQDRSYRRQSPDRSTSPDGRDRSHDKMVERSGTTDRSDLQSSQNSKTWREIYQEVRAEESDIDPEQSPRLQRALDLEFASVESTIDRSRSSVSRPSPQGRSKERAEDSSRSFRDSVPNSYEDRFPRSSEKESRSKVRSRIDSPLHMTEDDRLGGCVRHEDDRLGGRVRHEDDRLGGRVRHEDDRLGGRVKHDDVSPHIQELLDNLKDSQKSLRGIQDDMTTKATTSGTTTDSVQELGADRPRAGVYSSPMPGFKGKGSKSQDKPIEEQLSASLPASRSSRRPTEGQYFTASQSERRRTSDYRDMAERDLSRDSFNIEDILSSSERLNLRDKHSKHLSDLRAYYEEELSELRQALSDSETPVASTDTSMQSVIHNHLLEAENKHLLDKCKTMEDELEELYARSRALEQKNIGLEKRASEYAAAFADSQAMGVQHRAHIEELQRYCRERDDLVNDLESKVRSQDDGVKLYKKSFDEEMEFHRQDKIALQRITDRYESLDREYKLLQETMTSTESKLYEARTEIVELNRAMSKMELENKRLGRENDNLRHKVTQSLNLSTMHDSFGSPSSPRDNVTGPINRIRPRSAVHDPSVNESRVKPSDERVPGFTSSVSAGSWNSSVEKSTQSSKMTTTSKTKTGGGKRLDANVSDKREKRDTKVTSRKEGQEVAARKVTRPVKPSDQASLWEAEKYDRSRPGQREEQIPVRDQTPPRPASVTSQAESEISDYSPLLKAERELFKLRDMMRQAVAVKPSTSPPALKLQKKFYGSERPTSKDDYAPDLGPNRGRRDQPNNHTSVAKTKAAPSGSKSERVSERSGKRASSSRSERSSMKSQDRSEERERDRKDKPKEEERGNQQTPPRRKPASTVNPDIYDSPTRFDINVNDDRKTAKMSQKKGDNQSSKQRNLFDSDGDSQPVREGTAAKKDRNVQENGDRVSNTLDMMRNGQFTTRPQWEDVFTSMAKPKPEHQDKVKSMTTEDKVRERLRSISEMETRYDGLQMEKRQLESSINKIPLHGRVDRNSRRQKEQLEERLDTVAKEIGSLKMTLKRYNVLKTAG